MIDLIKSKPTVDEIFDTPSGHGVVYEARQRFTDFDRYYGLCCSYRRHI